MLLEYLSFFASLKIMLVLYYLFMKYLIRKMILVYTVNKV